MGVAALLSGLALLSESEPLLMVLAVISLFAVLALPAVYVIFLPKARVELARPVKGNGF